MRSFSIKELERLSNIKAHTIRIWENRYNVFKPQRTAGNIRLYGLDDVKLLLKLSLLVENGFRISRLVNLTTEEIELKTQPMLTKKGEKSKMIYALIVCMFATDIEEFELKLENCIISLGLHTTIQDIIIPFLDKVDILSYKDNSAAIHFAVTAVRKKLIVGIESIKPATAPTSSALLFLPKGEHFDLLLLYINYILKRNGIKTFYLGTNVSKENLEQIVLEKKPDYLFTYLPLNCSFDSRTLTDFITQQLPKSKLFIAESEDIARRFTSQNTQFFYYQNVERLFEDKALQTDHI